MTIKYQLPYNLMIKMGRELVNGSELPKEKPEVFLKFIDNLSWMMEGRKVDYFFTLFPPLKRYENDGTWDYKSTLEFKRGLGEFFSEDTFKKVLMTYCYENEFIHELGVGFMTSISELHRKQTGMEVMEEFLVQKGVSVYQVKNDELKPKLNVLKGGLIHGATYRPRNP